MKAFSLVVFAGSIAPNQSALQNGATPLLNLGEGVASTAAAAGKCARWMAAKLLLKLVVSAPSMAHMERANTETVPLA